ncbi:barstar family protein [Serratia microhaemolytica]|uniref:barstar family protein n=1 Tax=Serratia microhaemolytica TaxID=2675110 RepID=UPI000FDD3D48|nr:barstar family protein [Serratia microhaemolytica]
MQNNCFDFDLIPDLATFYRDFATQFTLEQGFGANLDALWDVVTADIPLPVNIVFIHLNPQRRQQFAAIIALFEQAEQELAGRLRFQITDRLPQSPAC